MAEKGFFLDNESYSAADVNTAFSCLTTEGVSLFEDSGNAVADLNGAIASLTSEGVDMHSCDSCMVYKSGESYMVKEGICFLPDGAFVRVDSDGVLLNVTADKVNYIYAMHDSLKNECRIYTSAIPGGYNSVPLAEIDANGKITDKRIFAMARVAVPTVNLTATKNLNVTFPPGAEEYGFYKEGYYCREITVDMGYSGFNYIYASNAPEPVLVDLSGSEPAKFYNKMNSRAWVKKNGNELLLTLGTKSGHAAQNRDITIILI